MNFSRQAYSFSLSKETKETGFLEETGFLTRSWSKILDTSDRQWMGPGTETPELLSPGESLKVNPWSLTIYQG